MIHAKKGMSGFDPDPYPWCIDRGMTGSQILYEDGFRPEPDMPFFAWVKPFFACDMLKKGTSGSGRNPSSYRIWLPVIPLSIICRHLFRAEPGIPFFGPVKKIYYGDQPNLYEHQPKKNLYEHHTNFLK
jgi:hypothetical protein